MRVFGRRADRWTRSGRAPISNWPGYAVQFSENVSFLEPSATLALAERARELSEKGRSIVDLSKGEPAYPTPEYAAEAGVRAIREGRTGYPPTAGVPELREAVADYLNETTERGELSASGVLVSVGAKQALFNVVYTLFGPGDEVLVPAPYWPTYPPLIRLAGAEPVVVPTRWQDRYRLTPELLERHRTDRTGGVLLNSPSNPTGMVYPSGDLADVAEWCGRHGLWALSDEIYRELCFVDDRAASLLDVPHRPERSVVFSGASKALRMPGWRIGFAVGPDGLIDRASDLQSQTTSGAATPSQYAAAEAFSNRERREEAIGRFVRRLADLREMGTGALSGLERLEVRAPEGAIYFYLRLRDGDSMEEAEALLTGPGVAVLPGDPFGDPGHLRFNFAVRPETLEEGVARMAEHFGG